VPWELEADKLAERGDQQPAPQKSVELSEISLRATRPKRLMRNSTTRINLRPEIGVRDLTHSKVLKPTVCATFTSALLCLPRLALWSNRRYPIWYLEAVIFAGGFVLWGFVFAWHRKYTGRPVFTLNLRAREVALVTVVGIGVALLLRALFDPFARQAIHEDYPLNLEEWVAMGLFTLALEQLFVLFAPYAWLMRLSKSPTVAFALTILVGLIVLALKLQFAHTPISPALLTALVIARITLGTLLLATYLRGGVLLTWWLGCLIHLHTLPV